MLMPNLARVSLFALALSLTTAPAVAKIVTITFTGVGNDLLASDPCHCWGIDAYGQSVIGSPFTATLVFDTAQGTTQIMPGQQILSEPGVMTGTFTINGHIYIPTGSTAATYYRQTNFVELVIYDDPAANTGLVLSASTTPTFGPNLADPIPTYFLNPMEMALSGFDVVIPQGAGELRAGVNVTSITVSSTPEPAAWALMLTGFGLVGAAIRASNKARRFAEGSGAVA